MVVASKRVFVSDKKARVIIFLGPPGSGKGTQAGLICKSVPGWVHVSTGDLFRKEISSGSALGNSVKGILAAGGLVQDDTTNQIFGSQAGQILKSQGLKGLLLDGYPRTGAQAKFLLDFVQKNSLEAPSVIELDVPEAEIVDRLSQRWVNPRSGRVYHAVSNPPKRAGVDDEDGQPLIQRPDDQPEVIRGRYKTYETQKGGILEALKGIAHRKVSGTGPIQGITDGLIRVVSGT